MLRLPASCSRSSYICISWSGSSPLPRAPGSPRNRNVSVSVLVLAKIIPCPLTCFLLMCFMFVCYRWRHESVMSVCVNKRVLVNCSVSSVCIHSPQTVPFRSWKADSHCPDHSVWCRRTGEIRKGRSPLGKVRNKPPIPSR